MGEAHAPPQVNCTHPNDKKFRCVYFFSHEYFGIIINRWIHTQYIAERIRSLGFFITIFYYSIFLPFVLVVVAQLKSEVNGINCY